ncbi:MAG TPA: HAD-IA family hydrolase [Terracidiphilus sp.]|nr:HAD-IA family hydrolase [Terracidiphilus sp.]
MASSSAPSPQIVRCQGILFDMDGILISSIGSVERSWTTWARMRGIDPDIALGMAHGRRAIETVAMLRPDLDAEAELKILEDLEIADNEGLRALPGVNELLRSLPADRWTVVTSATEKIARARLADGGIPVPAQLVTANHVTRGKPHPEPFVTGAAMLGFKPEECVVFEDSASGAIAGREAGCTVIATTFSHTAESLEAAHYLVSDLTGVTAEYHESGLILRFTPLIPVP